MTMSTFLGIAAPYTTQELYELWQKFRDNPDAERTLSDFMDSDTENAARLIDEFESKFQYEHCYEREGKEKNTMEDSSSAIKRVAAEKGINLLVQTGMLAFPSICPKQEVKYNGKTRERNDKSGF